MPSRHGAILCFLGTHRNHPGIDYLAVISRRNYTQTGISIVGCHCMRLRIINRFWSFQVSAGLFLLMVIILPLLC
jgi:hypothetical protein